MAAYPNYYGIGYQPMNQQYQPQQFQYGQYQQQVPQNASQAQNGIIWVQGEAGAKSYIVAAGQSILLMDSENSCFYIKSTDPSGMPLPLRIFDYTERNSGQNVPSEAATVPNVDMTNYVTREEFEEKLASLTSQCKSDTRNKEENNNG